MFEKVVGGFLRDPRDLTSMIDMSMKAYLLPKLPSPLGKVDQGFCPGLARCDAARSHTQSFGGKANTLNMVHAEKSSNTQHRTESQSVSIPFADSSQVVRLKIIRIATRDHNVLQVWVIFKVLEHQLPALSARLLWLLRD